MIFTIIVSIPILFLGILLSIKFKDSYIYGMFLIIILFGTIMFFKAVPSLKDVEWECIEYDKISYGIPKSNTETFFTLIKNNKLIFYTIVDNNYIEIKEEVTIVKNGPSSYKVYEKLKKGNFFLFKNSKKKKEIIISVDDLNKWLDN